MLKNYLKIAFRSIINEKGYSFINILGLSIAIASCFLLLFWVKFELSYENCYPNADRICRLMQVEKRTDGLHYDTFIRPGISDGLKNAFPQIEASTFTHSETLPFTAGDQQGEDGINGVLLTTNQDFLRMFAFEYIEGSPQSAVQAGGYILSHEMAYKFFGNESAIGKSIGFAGDMKVVSAVIKLPKNTQIKFDVLEPSGEIMYGVHYFMLKKGTSITPDFESQIAQYLIKTRETKNEITIQRLKDIHLYTPEEITDSTYGSLAQLYFFSGAVLLILLMAVINYINTSIARALGRTKEVGVHKVTGANRRQLIERFLLESFLLSFISMVVALMLVRLLFPDFSEIMGNRIPLDFDWSAVLIAIVTCIVVTLLSGGYAAFYLSSFSPIDIFRGVSKTGTKDGLRKGLIGFQFFLSVSVLICTLLIYKQINAIFNAETGVDRKHIVVLETSLWYDAENFINLIKQENVNVVDASIALSAPYNSSYGYSGVTWTGCKDGANEMEFTQINCDHNYASTFGLEVIQGRFIPPNLKWWGDIESKSMDIVINESFKKLMGVDDPIGIMVSYAWGMQGKVIGVVKDFNFKPLKEPISPLIIAFNPEVCNKVYVKTTGKDKQQTLDYVLAKYKEMKPDNTHRPVVYHTVDDEYNKMYEVELRTAGVLSVSAIISFLLSLMGIISMTSFLIEKRTKEIAIRCINGALIGDIILLFSRNTLAIAALASIVSIPICYIIMHQWLESYIYRTTLSWWIFVSIPIALMFVLFMVIAIQVYFTAHKNPVNSLRSE